MNRFTAPPAENFYSAHRLEAREVADTEEKIFEIHTYMAETYPNSKPIEPSLHTAYEACLKVDLRRVEIAHKAHEIAHVALARGLKRNRDDFERQEANYMTEALYDAKDDGVRIAGWEE